MKSLMIKGELGSLEINILKRRDSKSNDYWDAHWLETGIQIEVPGFSAHYQANLHIEDLKKWHEDLDKALASASGSINFSSIEEEIFLECLIKKNGAVVCAGKANDHTGSCLDFTLISDLASLGQLFEQLKRILVEYPAVGER